MGLPLNVLSTSKFEPILKLPKARWTWDPGHEGAENYGDDDGASPVLLQQVGAEEETAKPCCETRFEGAQLVVCSSCTDQSANYCAGVGFQYETKLSGGTFAGSLHSISGSLEVVSSEHVYSSFLFAKRYKGICCKRGGIRFYYFLSVLISFLVIHFEILVLLTRRLCCAVSL